MTLLVFVTSWLMLEALSKITFAVSFLTFEAISKAAESIAVVAIFADRFAQLQVVEHSFYYLIVIF